LRTSREPNQTFSEIVNELLGKALENRIIHEKKEKRYNVTIIARFGGVHFSHPWLSGRQLETKKRRPASELVQYDK
jgi:hypothetical protein